MPSYKRLPGKFKIEIKALEARNHPSEGGVQLDTTPRATLATLAGCVINFPCDNNDAVYGRSCDRTALGRLI